MELDEANEPDMPDRVLAIMAKAPRLGHVKTRLSPTLAEEDILALYKCLMEDTLNLVRFGRTLLPSFARPRTQMTSPNGFGRSRLPRSEATDSPPDSPPYSGFSAAEATVT